MVPVTFLLPVYNGEKFLSEALKSIQDQTFKDFEVLIINDGSTDSSQSIIDDFAATDKRFKCIQRENRGLIKTLNEGLDVIQTKYIARMDADDICHPERLQKQMDFMEANPEVGVCGSRCLFFGLTEREIHYPLTHERIVATIPYGSPFCHPSVMYRKSVFEEHAIRYDESFKDCEDYKMWLDLSSLTKMANIDDVLLYYRKHGESVSDQSAVQKQGSQLVRKLAISKTALPASSKNFHLDLTARRYDALNLDYWPIYLSDLKKLGKEYFETGFSNFKFFAISYLPQELARQLVECVKNLCIQEDIAMASAS